MVWTVFLDWGTIIETIIAIVRGFILIGLRNFLMWRERDINTVSNRIGGFRRLLSFNDTDWWTEIDIIVSCRWRHYSTCKFKFISSTLIPRSSRFLEWNLVRYSWVVDPDFRLHYHRWRSVQTAERRRRSLDNSSFLSLWTISLLIMRLWFYCRYSWYRQLRRLALLRRFLGSERNFKCVRSLKWRCLTVLL